MNILTYTDDHIPSIPKFASHSFGRFDKIQASEFPNGVHEFTSVIILRSLACSVPLFLPFALRLRETHESPSKCRDFVNSCTLHHRLRR